MDTITQALVKRSGTPQSPDFDAVLQIVREDDCRICFARKINNRTDFQPLFSLTPAELKDKPFLPTIEPYLLTDSYFTPNGFFTAYLNNPIRKHRDTGLPGPKRTSDNLRYLFAHFADLDVGRRDRAHPYNLSVGQAIGMVIDEALSGRIPAPSILGISGQGVYVYWLLRDAGGENGVRAYPANVLTWKTVNRELNSRLEHAGADMKVAGNPTSLLGMPGSQHTTAKRYVSYLPLYDQDKQPFTYTLPQIADHVNVRMIETQARRILNRDTAPELSAKRSAAGKRGAHVKARKRLQDILKVSYTHGGFPHGKRRMSLSLAALYMRRSGHDPKETLKALQALARECRPPYPSENNDTSINRIVADVWTEKDGFSNKRLSSHYLAKVFEVNDDECLELELQSIVTANVQETRKRLPSPRTTALTWRRKAIEMHIGNYPQTRNYSFRQWEKILSELYGIQASYQTIKNDFDALGYIRTPGTPGRPRKR